MYLEQPIKKYLEDLGARLPSPGGGSAAALVGALGTSLASMSCNFTAGNLKFEGNEAEIKGILSNLSGMTVEFEQLIDEDAKAYAKVTLAYKLSKNTFEEKEKRRAAIQKALNEAMVVPTRIAKLASEILDISSRLIDIANPGLITDTAMSAILAFACLESAVLNVEINLYALDDKDFIQKTQSELNQLIEKGRVLKEEVSAKTEKLVIKESV